MGVCIRIARIAVLTLAPVPLDEISQSLLIHSWAADNSTRQGKGIYHRIPFLSMAVILPIALQRANCFVGSSLLLFSFSLSVLDPSCRSVDKISQSTLGDGGSDQCP